MSSLSGQSSVALRPGMNQFALQKAVLKGMTSWVVTPTRVRGPDASIIHFSSFYCLLSRALQIPSLGPRTVMLKSLRLYSVVNKAVSFLRSIYLERRTWGGIIMNRA